MDHKYYNFLHGGEFLSEGNLLEMFRRTDMAVHSWILLLITYLTKGYWQTSWNAAKPLGKVHFSTSAFQISWVCLVVESRRIFFWLKSLRQHLEVQSLGLAVKTDRQNVYIVNWSSAHVLFISSLFLPLISALELALSLPGRRDQHFWFHTEAGVYIPTTTILASAETSQDINALYEMEMSTSSMHHQQVNWLKRHPGDAS